MRRRGKVIPFPVRPGAARPQGEQRALTELHRCGQAEAVVLKSLLESEGIPALLRTRMAQSVYPFSVGAQGEVVVLVPESDIVRGRSLLARLESGPRPL
jgi:flagella basal body P-ring formation protein FlgA